MQERIRLHISPFSQELLPVVLGSPLSASASSISFHQVPTFPERPFGFVELPVMEASKLKKKVNGTILKGKKMKVEEARQDSRKNATYEDDTLNADDGSSRKLRKSERKRGREEGILEGYELPTDRKVKRGWTEPVDSLKRKKSKKDKKPSDEVAIKKRSKPSVYTDQPECLFQAQLPAGVPPSSEAGAKKVKSKKKGTQNHVVVHEFEKNKKTLSFITDSSRTGNTNSMQEPVKDSDTTDKAPLKTRSQKRNRRGSSAAALQTLSTHGTDRKAKSTLLQRNEVTESEEDADEASPGTSSHSEKDDDSATIAKRARTSSSATPAVEVTQSSPTVAEPHPLEKLFKRPKAPTSNPSGANKQGLEVKIPFSFFGNEEVDDGIEKSMETPGLPGIKRGKASGLPNLSIPITPYTQRDMHWRSQRSAAPTPDTAAPSKSGFGEVWSRLHEDREDDIEEEEEIGEDLNGDDDQAGPSSSQKKLGGSENEDESEFTKWFWENRGDNNRAWKKKRREAAKEQRQRENKRHKKTT